MDRHHGQNKTAVPYRNTGMFSLCQGNEQQLLYISQKIQRSWRQVKILSRAPSLPTLPFQLIQYHKLRTQMQLHWNMHICSLPCLHFCNVIEKQNWMQKACKTSPQTHHNKITAQHPGFCKNHAGCLKSKPIQASLGLSAWYKAKQGVMENCFPYCTHVVSKLPYWQQGKKKAVTWQTFQMQYK